MLMGNRSQSIDRECTRLRVNRPEYVGTISTLPHLGNRLNGIKLHTGEANDAYCDNDVQDTTISTLLADSLP